MTTARLPRIAVFPWDLCRGRRLGEWFFGQNNASDSGRRGRGPDLHPESSPATGDLQGEMFRTGFCRVKMSQQLPELSGLPPLRCVTRVEIRHLVSDNYSGPDQSKRPRSPNGMVSVRGTTLAHSSHAGTNWLGKLLIFLQHGCKMVVQDAHLAPQPQGHLSNRSNGK